MEHLEQSHLHLRYALQKGTENNLLFVDGVPNGLKCNCVCPYCKVDLIARQGKKKEHHFAHKNNKNCTGGRMTALHLLAQSVLAETKQVMLPAYNGEYFQRDAKIKTFDRVNLEEVCRNEDSKRRPDCIGYNDSKGGNIWIEIYCQHKIDETKKAEIRQQQQYCIEIDFSDLLNTNYSEVDVKNRLLDTSHREWICCPIWDAKEEMLRAEAEAAEEREKKRIEEENRRRAEEDDRVRQEEEKRAKELRAKNKTELRNHLGNKKFSPVYRSEHESKYKTPKVPLEKKDRIIQAVLGFSIIPSNENYSAEKTEQFFKAYPNA